MLYPRSNQLDYVESDETEIDHGPHWSSRRVSLGFMPPPVQRSAALLPATPPPLRTPAVGTPAIGAPVVMRAPIAERAPVLILPVAASMRAPLPPPLRAPTAFYSYAEDAARRHLDTERVAPLPMSDLEDPWVTHLHGTWQRFAGPALGMIAALILVVGYLAYSSQSGGGTATSTALGATLTMPVVVAPIVTEDSFNVPADPPAAEPRAPTVPAAAETADVPPQRSTAKRMSSKKRISSSSSTASKGKRRPIRFDTSTPLGSLRPGRY